MGNIIGSFFSGFGKVIGDLFGSPLDFLAGKSCSSVCGSTWDFICYVENFCVTNLLKMAMVLVLIYIVLLFLYLLHKLGICECMSQGLCRMVWACLACFFRAWEYCCIFLWVKLHKLKRVHREHRRDIEDEFNTSDEEYDDDDDGESFSYHVPMDVISKPTSHRWRDYRGAHLRKSLRPRSTHRIQVGISRDSSIHGGRSRSGNPAKHGNHIKAVDHDHIRVIRTSKFAHKGRYHRGGVYHRRRY